MKTTILVAAALVLGATFSSAQTAKKIDDNNGFKNYKLGTRYQLVYGAKAKQTDGSDLVKVPAMNQKIGDIPVTSIDLVYVNDILSRILVHFEPQQNAKLLEACKNSFGGPEDISETSRTGTNQVNHYVWKGTKVKMEYVYSYPKASGSSNAVQDLHLQYTYNDYDKRVENSTKGKYSSKDF
jgi:hypothetical protein